MEFDEIDIFHFGKFLIYNEDLEYGNELKVYNICFKEKISLSGGECVIYLSKPWRGGWG